jgi:hypothetical protein
VGGALAAALGTEPCGQAPGQILRDQIRRHAARPRFATVHSYSTHNLLLRYWLDANGIDPDKDIELSVVPPAAMVDAMAAGEIDGFCAGAPWGAVAARRGLGRTIVTSNDIWRNHPEKCLAVSARWAEENPDLLEAMLDALLAAAQFCDAPENAAEVAAILADPSYLAIEPALIRASLPDDEDAPPRAVGRSAFFANAATFPWRSQARWFLDQMARWNYLPATVDRAALTAGVYRPDLYRQTAQRAGLSSPTADAKAEGAHDAPWQADGDSAPIPMGADRFCDGRVFT